MIFEEYFLILSSKPTELLKHYYREFNNEIEEATVVKLENGNYLYLSFSGIKDNQDVGVTDHQEFASEKEAIEVFEGFYGI